jgi:hypothetical protein
MSAYLSIGDFSKASHLTVKTLRHYHQVAPPRDVGRVRGRTIPEGEFAVLTHSGSPADVDRTYAALATYVARHSLGVDGPIREYYLVGQHDTADTAQWRTEIAWPVFLTTAPTSVERQVASSTDH